MTLTKHQLLHLNAIIVDTKLIKNKREEDRKIEMEAKNIKKGKEDKYLGAIIKDANDIIKNDEFPDLEEPWMIHDYIEKETKEEYHG